MFLRETHTCSVITILMRLGIKTKDLRHIRVIGINRD